MTQVHSHTSAESPDAPSALTGYRRTFDAIFAYLTALFVLAVLLQVFFAGLGAFHGSAGFGPHEDLGNILGIAAVVIMVISFIAHVSWRVMVCAFVMALLTETAQHALAQFGFDHPWLGATHALDGMIILLLGVGLAVTSLRRTRPAAAS